MTEKLGYCKDVKMRPAGQGWIVEYSKHTKSERNEYEGYSFLGNVEEVFEDPTDATDRAEEIYNSPMYIPNTKEDYNVMKMKK